MRRRTISVAFAALFVGAGVYAASAFATPASGFSGTTIAVGRINHAFARFHEIPMSSSGSVGGMCAF